MKEHFDLLKRGIFNIKNISNAWLNSIKNKYDLLSDDLKQEAENRLSICNGCIFNSERAKKELNYKTSFDYYHCSSCKCPIEKKIFSFDENCGLEWFLHNASKEDQKHILEYFMNNPKEEIKLKFFKI